MKLGHMMIGLAAGLAIAVSAPAMAKEKVKDKGKPGAEIDIPAPPAGKGQIVFFRPGGMGAALGCSVNENGEKVSSLGSGRYFVMVSDPGTHEFSVHSEAKDTLGLLVESDETQFAKCKIKMGILVGRPDISPSSEKEFRSQKKLKLVDDDDMGPAPGALRRDDLAAALGEQPAADEAVGDEAAEDTSESE